METREHAQGIEAENRCHQRECPQGETIVKDDPRSALLTWIEIDEAALASNLRYFRSRLARDVSLQAVIKSNAYGHGLEQVARIAARSGADSFGVHTAEEALQVSHLQLGKPVLVLGYVGPAQAQTAVAAQADVTVYNITSLEALSAAARAAGRVIGCHVKIETGAGRQGIMPHDLDAFLDALARFPALSLAGVSTHFANIEDTTDHRYARLQLERFQELSEAVRRRAPEARRHCACSAAILTMHETSFDMVRVGIGLYGLWPSKETLLSCLLHGREEAPLRPVLTWKTRIAQIKTLPAGSFVGYGCSHRTARPTRLAVLPIGYADGYDRRLSGIGRVLVGGSRAPVLGRICMNMMMVDVTDAEGAQTDAEVVLIGRQGSEEIGVEQIAGICNTIVYEIVARISPQIVRVVVGADGSVVAT